MVAQLLSGALGAGEDPALELALPLAMLRQVSQGARPETVRIYRPATPMVAFGRRDTRRPGFGAAVTTARKAGFATGVRAPGGRVVAYTTEALVIDHLSPGGGFASGLNERFAAFGELFAEALGTLGIDARVGEVPGEYCPGAHSINARGLVKLIGTAQRVVAGAWLFSSVVIVGGTVQLQPLLGQLHDQLELPFAAASVGSILDENPGADVAAVESAIRAAYASRYDLEPGSLDPQTLEQARELLPGQVA